MPQAKEELLADVNLSAATRAAHDEVVAMRHDLHRIPEIGLKEYKTAEYIEGKLGAAGVEFERITATGIKGLIDSGMAGPTVMLRSDIDALPAQPLRHIDNRALAKAAASRPGSLSTLTSREEHRTP